MSPDFHIRTVLAGTIGLLLGTSSESMAFELNAGVSVGGMVSTGAPRMTLSPHFAVAWQAESGLRLSLHDLFSVLLPIGGAKPGIYNQISGSIGYAWERVNVSAGPSCSVYFIPTCYGGWCGRVVGIAPGGHLHGSAAIAGPLGMWARVNVDWLNGRSLVLPSGPAAMVVAGPLIRW
jgi:hypothetical protein